MVPMKTPGATTMLGDLHRATPWLWLNCERCQHQTRRSRARSPLPARAARRIEQTGGCGNSIVRPNVHPDWKWG
jgi:hypothetical protein